MSGVNFLKTAVAAGFMALTAGAANASLTTTYCPGTAGTGDREFTVSVAGPAAGCVLWGAGNTDTPTNSGLILAEVDPSVLLDKSDGASLVSGIEIVVTGMGTLAGTWSIALPTSLALTNVYIAFKSGNGQIDPDWALFSITDGVLTGNWSIANGNQSLSHVSLYGSVAAVPVPAAGFLLFGALAGLAALRRRKTA